ncbi:MAG: immunoglobulin-like domain-containing protein, partial [Candidatus Ornithomonoglobus sp.]
MKLKRFISLCLSTGILASSLSGWAMEQDIEIDEADISVQSEDALQIVSDEAEISTLTIPVDADTYVRSNNNENHGSDTKLNSLASGGVSSRWTVMRFDLSSIPETAAIVSAKLCVTGTSDNDSTVARHKYPFNAYYIEDDSWDESTIKVKPEMGRLIIPAGDSLVITSATAPKAEEIYRVDITDAVVSEYYNDTGKKLSTIFETAYDGNQTWGTQIWSKEAELDDMFKPHLELEIIEDAADDVLNVRKDWAALALGESDELNETELTESIDLPAEGENGSVISWSSSNENVLTADGTLIPPSYTDGTQKVTLTAVISCGESELEKKFTFFVKPFIKAEDWLTMEKETIIEKFDRITAVKDLDFYTEGVRTDEEGNPSGVAISWSSANKSVISDDGKVTLPGADEKGANVTVTVTLTKDDARMSFDITIIVPKTAAVARTAARDSLKNVIEYCKEYIKTLYTGDEPGAITEESLSDFNTAIESAEAVYADGERAYSEYNSAIQNLIAYGLSVFETMKLDDTKIEGSLDDERVFSEYRAEVMKNVFEGETLLRTYPELYTDGDKVELRDKIDFANSVLDGTYKRPFNRNREFVRPRKDEMLQRLLYHAYVGRVYGYSADSRFDLEQTISWYRTTNILYQAYSTIEIDPVIDGELQVAAPINTTADSARIGNLCTFRGQIHPTNRNSDRAYALKFNYGDLDMGISGVSLELTNSSTSNSYNITYAVMSDSYDDKITDGVMLKDLTASEFVDNTQAVADGDTYLLVENKLASGWEYSSGTAKYLLRQSTDLYRGFQKDKNGILSVVLYESVASQNYDNSVFTSRADVEEYRPKLVIKTTDVDMSTLYEKIEYVKDRYEEFKKWYEPGTGLGKVDSGKYNAVEAAVKAMDAAWDNNEESFVIGSKIVAVYNAMRDARQSRTLLSDIDKNATIFFSEADGDALRKAITKDAELQSVYNDMKKSADGTSMQKYKEQLPLIGKTNYEGMGFTAEEGMFDEKGDVSVEYAQKHFKYTTNSNVQATAPENAKTVKVELNLPAGEWEGVGDGQGHVWFDNISGYGTTSTFDIKNPSFETGTTFPENWTFVTNGSGNSEFKWEDTANLVSAGLRSAYIQNNDPEADCSLISDAIEIVAGEQYTVTMNARLDRVLLGNNQLPRYNDSGVQMILHWYDANGNELSSNNVWHNKRAGTGPLCNQADAIVYFMTGEKEYAEKAKYGILLKLNDIAQGAEEWIMTNSRPNNVDSYGGVQIGRNLCVLSQMYSLIKNSGVFNDYEQDLVAKLFEENIRFMADYRDRSELTQEDFSDVGNWATDTWAGTAMVAMAMPEYKESRQLLDNGLYLLSGQIDTAIGENGTYPESTRYMWAGINRFSLYAYCNAVYEGLDCFGNTYLGKLYKYAVDIQTPYYSYLGYSSSPPFGDNTLASGNFGLAYAYLDQIYKLDPELSQALYKTWVNAGRPHIGYGSEDVGIPALFAPTQFKEDNSYKLSLSSNNDYPESMGPIFRDNFGVRGKETYVAINAPTRTTKHMHDDTGQIIFYANSEPMIMDPGVEGYFDATTLGWFKGSASHSVLQFYGTSDWSKCPNPGDSDVPSVVEQFVTNDNIDFSKVKIQHSGGEQVRNVAYLRGGINALVVWDDVTSTAKARTNWGTQAKSVSISGNKFISIGHFNMDLETTILPAEDSSRKYSTKWGRMTISW